MSKSMKKVNRVETSFQETNFSENWVRPGTSTWAPLAYLSPTVKTVPKSGQTQKMIYRDDRHHLSLVYHLYVACYSTDFSADLITTSGCTSQSFRLEDLWIRYEHLATASDISCVTCFVWIIPRSRKHLDTENDIKPLEPASIARKITLQPSFWSLIWLISFRWREMNQRHYTSAHYNGRDSYETSDYLS